MVKKKKNKIKIARPHWDLAFHFMAGIGYGALFIFLTISIYSTLEIPKLVGFLNDPDDKADIEFLRQARQLNTFRVSLFPEMAKTFSSREYEIYSIERTRKEKIAVLESFLVDHPQARDVLYALALLYQRTGEYNKSQEYMNKALAVDPEVVK
ncbi:hypothetical protein A3A93_05745 [Candidatus Roizmanbacteria bacterium RIFCSPLOWO2_01_FULL_38_12]|uniref:Uncharacterized protein n=1 Tax=Candidatus Roizmanbacteria bacterium RIFCSPLOWO2_01_FULL_38_12 TaxID=1802061 RepID=A0A1F7IV94_9BACT|nr:MAG: hypothetical protein A3F59_03385 [Candidatus Roizmanbacteria bacterium RIFCSPHIGHO2_12_FULL_38_13]OGK47265.1 MAG: hypothetical protein A3A93_05745 [Candidatus Roizmanbacteria bacterium RIFCSPLOWO2_01_FULL_38_12]